MSKPCLSQTNIQERLQFATIHKDWTVEDWKWLVFSDETKISCFNADGSWCWVSDKENLLHCAIKQTVKHGGGSEMLWSCMTSRGLGDSVKIERRVNAEEYIVILYGNLYLSLEKLGYFILGKEFFSKNMLLYIEPGLLNNGS